MYSFIKKNVLRKEAINWDKTANYKERGKISLSLYNKVEGITHDLLKPQAILKQHFIHAKQQCAICAIARLFVE